MAASTVPRESAVTEIGLGLVLGASFLVTTALHVADAPVLLGTLAMALVVGLGGRALTVQASCAAALGGWALVTGLVVNELGQLTFSHGDLLRLACLAAAGVAGSAARGLPRRGGVRIPSSDSPFPSEIRADRPRPCPASLASTT